MTDMNSPAALAGDREITAMRVFNAPRDLVFRAWTEQKHVEQWWGPRGFSTTTHTMEVKPGGVWRFVMRGPDGREYPNKTTYLEVVKPERLVYYNAGEEDKEVNHQVTVTFEELGGKTRVKIRMTFASPAAREHVVKTYGAVDGLNQHLGRLEEHLAAGAVAREKPFVVSRTFNAPRGKVWKAWTEESQLMKWFGPKGFTMRVGKLDLRPGGVFHYCLRSPDGKDMWGKFVYREITPQEKIVLVNSFSDEAGNLTRHPLSPTWPLEMLSTTTFTEKEGKTTITLEWRPLNASAEELNMFNASHDGMNMGWKGTFEQLDEYLARG